MTYRVIGERTINQGEVDRHTSTFTLYTDATLYYSQTFAQVSEDMCDLGGEFVITLIADGDDGKFEVMKRHVASTTVLI